ncbi:hypothetical protein GBAR_LOCUS7784, partial [Geodia barretti]
MKKVRYRCSGRKDGHSTHYQPQVIKFAMEHQCIILCLPPHTTHESQPLDVGVFAPLKVQWSTVCHKFYQKNPGKVINRFNFSTMFSEAWYGAITPNNIMGGFRKAGVFPFDPEAVTLSTPPDNSAKIHCSAEVRETSPEMVSPNNPDLETVPGESASGSSESVVGDPCTSKTSISDSCTLQTAVSDLCTPKASDLYTPDPTE